MVSLFWIGFVVLILLMLALDLGVFHKEAHVVTVHEAVRWFAIWLSVGLLFGVFVYFAYEGHWLGLGMAADPVDGVINDGWTALSKYLTGYVVEESLSVDNIFVIAMIFQYFAVPPLYQHRVLFWGILGALVLRGTMIGIGATLVAEFHWILYVFAAFLIVTALRMLFWESEDKPPDQNVIVRIARRLFPVTVRFHGEHFMVRAGSAAALQAESPGHERLPDVVVDRSPVGKLLLTPLAITLIMVETTDLIFAVDSIPAIFAITGDPFLVFTSNVFAILGLRSLYFALAGMVTKFRYLKVALALVLLVVGVKMLVAGWLRTVIGEHFNLVLLAVVVSILVVGVLASLWADRKENQATV